MTLRESHNRTPCEGLMNNFFIKFPGNAYKHVVILLKDEDFFVDSNDIRIS
jgi:hypothetical protein